MKEQRMAKNEDWRETVHIIIWDRDLVEEYRSTDDLHIIKSTLELIEHLINTDMDDHDQQSSVKLTLKWRTKKKETKTKQK